MGVNSQEEFLVSSSWVRASSFSSSMASKMDFFLLRSFSSSSRISLVSSLAMASFSSEGMTVISLEEIVDLFSEFS